MFKNITIGSYFPGESVVHRADPRAKIILTLFYIVMLFMAQNPLALALGTLYAVIAYAASGIPFGLILRSVKPVVPVVIFTALLNMLFIEGSTVYLNIGGILMITKEGLIAAGLMTVRIVSLIIGSSLLTYTTSPISLTDGIEKLLDPLKAVKVPSHEIAMIMTIALRFIPTLIEETEKIISAQKARGADMETGKFTERARAMIPILIPLFVSSFRRAEELALAMECRCYRGGEGRTRMKELKFSGADVLCLCMTAVFFAGVIYANTLFPNMSITV